ncbi:MAG: hypothetical protein IPG93_12080 [Burkholderiales bacterium]|nr:hypothetical protein [Burkholderiales bacterium]
MKLGAFSVSLAVKDMATLRACYGNSGFTVFGSALRIFCSSTGVIKWLAGSN